MGERELSNLNVTWGPHLYYKENYVWTFSFRLSIRRIKLYLRLYRTTSIDPKYFPAQNVRVTICFSKARCTNYWPASIPLKLAGPSHLPLSLSYFTLSISLPLSHSTAPNQPTLLPLATESAGEILHLRGWWSHLSLSLLLSLSLPLFVVSLIVISLSSLPERADIKARIGYLLILSWRSGKLNCFLISNFSHLGVTSNFLMPKWYLFCFLILIQCVHLCITIFLFYRFRYHVLVIHPMLIGFFSF